MCAVMQSKRANRPAPKIWNSLMPEDAVRDPAMAFPAADVSSFHSPYLKEQPFNLPCHIRLGEEVKFEESSMGAMALLWGWPPRRTPHLRSYGEDSALMLRLGPELFDEGDFVTLHFCTYGYVAENLGPQTLDIIVNGETKGRAVHTAEAQYAETAVALERPSHPHALVRFRPSYVRNADRDGGADKRAIGFVLVKISSIAIYDHGWNTHSCQLSIDGPGLPYSMMYKKCPTPRCPWGRYRARSGVDIEILETPENHSEELFARSRGCRQFDQAWCFSGNLSQDAAFFVDRGHKSCSCDPQGDFCKRGFGERSCRVGQRSCAKSCRRFDLRLVGARGTQRSRARMSRLDPRCLRCVSERRDSSS